MGDRAHTLYEAEIRRLPSSERLRLVELITRDLASGARPNDLCKPARDSRQ